jgi:hypothetical protein
MPTRAGTGRGGAVRGQRDPDRRLPRVYWDLRYFSRKARHEGWSSGELQDSVRPLSWNELIRFACRCQLGLELGGEALFEGRGTRIAACLEFVAFNHASSVHVGD